MNVQIQPCFYDLLTHLFFFRGEFGPVAGAGLSGGLPVEGILKLSSAQSRLAAGGYSGTPAVSLPRRGLKHGGTLDGIHLVHSVESI